MSYRLDRNLLRPRPTDSGWTLISSGTTEVYLATHDDAAGGRIHCAKGFVKSRSGGWIRHFASIKDRDQFIAEFSRRESSIASATGGDSCSQ